MTILNSLRLSHKLVVLGFIALLMAALPTTLYVQTTWHDIMAAQREIAGSTPAVALQKVIQLTQQHRGLTAGMLGGNEALAAKLPSTRNAITQAIQTVDLSLQRADSSEQLTSAWNERKARWHTLEQDISNRRIKSSESTQRHTQLIRELMLFNEALMDEFKLTLDPLIENHALINASLVEAPALAEKLGQLRAQGTGFLAQGSLPPESRAGLVALRRRADEVYGDMMRNLGKATRANASLKTELSTQAEALKTQIDRTLLVADQGLIDAQELKLPANEYFDEFTRTINSIYQFNAIALSKLSGMLDSRLNSLRQAAYLVLSMLLLTATACVALGLTLVRHITRQLGTEPHLAADLARAVAEGNLSVPIVLRQGDSTSLMAQLKEMQTKLSRVVSDIRQNSESVAMASVEIAQGNNDLSSRTEQQASALEETASSMEQLSSTVKQNADNAHQAHQLAAGASAVAVKGGEVVSQVIDTMRDINESSKKIADIISVIDGIAFQTNILALNAAVEAARAGEQGRGFAVVAGEVRSLAQRSAQAAKEIKSLITTSVERVEQGTRLVDHAGVTMVEIVNAIKQATDIIQNISSASNEQNTGVAQVSEAINQIDQTTQQNAALVEQSAAAAESLKLQASQLVQTVAIFKLLNQ